MKELDATDIDGCVPVIGWGLESIRRYSRKRIVSPLEMTVAEAI